MLLLNSPAIIFGECVRFVGWGVGILAKRWILLFGINSEHNVPFSPENQIHLDSERLFTVVLKFSELKLWQIQNNILLLGSQRRACFSPPPLFFRFCWLKRLFPFSSSNPSSAHLQTMQPYCGSVWCGAILFCSVPGRQANHQWWLLEVWRLASNPLCLLAACLWFVGWHPQCSGHVGKFFDSGRMEAAAFVLLQLHETNKHAIGHKETSKRLCLKQNLVFVRTAGEKTGLDCF